MKNWFWIPLAAISGVIAGSWGPREDLERFKENVREERTQKKASGAAGFDAFARLANIPDVASRRAGSKSKVGNVPAKTATNSVAEVAQPVPTEAKTNAVARGGRPDLRSRLSREDLRARIEEAAELWQTRVELAKTQWKEKLGISGQKESEAFESAVATMNESLRDAMQALADEIERAGKMTPELSLRMMGDAARVMAEAYDAVGAAVPEDRRAEVSDMPVFEFIDPMAAEPLIGVQDKLDGGFGRNFRREGRGR